MPKKNKCFSRKMFQVVYSSLLVEETSRKEIREHISNNNLELDEKQTELIIQCLKNKDNLIPVIEHFLVKWKFRRLALVDQSILLLATHYILNSLCDDPLVISVSLEIIKEFSDFENYKYINAVLDKISKNKVTENE